MHMKHEAYVPATAKGLCVSAVITATFLPLLFLHADIVTGCFPSLDILHIVPFGLAPSFCADDNATVSLQIGLYSISFGFAWGPIGWLVPSEIHDLNTRSAGQSITVFTQLVSGATVTQSTSSHLRVTPLLRLCLMRDQ